MAQSPLQDALLIPAQPLLCQGILQNFAFPEEPLSCPIREFTACSTAVVGRATALVLGRPLTQVHALRVQTSIALARRSRAPQCPDELVSGCARGRRQVFGQGGSHEAAGAVVRHVICVRLGGWVWRRKKLTHVTRRVDPSLVGPPAAWLVMACIWLHVWRSYLGGPTCLMCGPSAPLLAPFDVPPEGLVYRLALSLRRKCVAEGCWVL